MLVDESGTSAIAAGLSALLPGAGLVAVGLIGLTVLYAVTVNALSKVATKNKTKKKEEVENPKKHTVYKLVDEDKVEYVGRTNNTEATKKRHGNNPYRKNLKFIEIESNLTYEEARGLEQINIEYYGTLNRNNPTNNQINGISKLNPSYDKYMEAGFSAMDNLTYVGGGIPWEPKR